MSLEWDVSLHDAIYPDERGPVLLADVVNRTDVGVVPIAALVLGDSWGDRLAVKKSQKIAWSSGTPSGTAKPSRAFR